MKVPYESLSKAALRGVIEEFVSREGTDYGAEHSLDDKVADVMRQLRRGLVHIVFDPASETVSILPTDKMKELEDEEDDLSELDDVW